MSWFNQYLTSLDLDPVSCGAATTIGMPPPTASATSNVKHRACDECRHRKLACSKQPDGCERCKGENIACHYSEQKPMGRPRKRQFVETTKEKPTNDQMNGTQGPRLLQPSPDDFDLDTVMAEPYFTIEGPTALLTNGSSVLPTTKTNGESVVWHFADHEIMTEPPINFEGIDLISGVNLTPPIAPTPQLSTILNSSVIDRETSAPQSNATAGPCSCLASMYLALASLQNFPPDIIFALSTVRGAAATASQCIWCPRCGSVLLDHATPPIESFQNTMLLGTILPIIANAYEKLLTMIDRETDEALAAGQLKTFRFHDYGGMCGRQETVQQAMTCIEKEFFFSEVEMPPAQWRTTVRALLRVDIYGHEQLGIKHKGLRDLVSEIEYRQCTRHNLLDAQIATGTYDKSMLGHGIFNDGKCLDARTSRDCLEIFKIAKTAIENLVIA